MRIHPLNWLRAFGIEEKVFWQEDWGEEFGGDNPEKLRKLDATYYRPYGAVLGRAPKGRHGYQGRVERSHRTDDEEFYIPLLLSIKNEKQLLHYARKWLYWYNVKRPHFGKGMEGKPPFEKLQEFYCNLPDKFALLPPIILDDISTFWQIRGGNDLLTPYNDSLMRFQNPKFSGISSSGVRDFWKAHFRKLTPLCAEVCGLQKFEAGNTSPEGSKVPGTAAERPEIS